MKDLPSLLVHPNVKTADTVFLLSGKPVVLVQAGAQRALGKPLNNQQIGNLLKATLPPDVMTECQWGKEVDFKFPAGGRFWHLHIVLSQDHQFKLEIRPTDAPAAPSDHEAEDEKRAAFDEEIDDLVASLTHGEDLALIFSEDKVFSDQIKEMVATLGFTPKVTGHVGAASEVLKYHDYDLLVFQLGANFQNHPLFREYSSFTMDMRRKHFSVLVAPGLRTGDRLTAFSHSVNLVVAEENLSLLVGETIKVMAVWKRQTEPFFKALNQFGRL